MAQKKKTIAKKKPAKKASKKKSAKKSVYLVEISLTGCSGVYVKAESPEAAKRWVKDKEIAFSGDLPIDWGDIQYECDGEDHSDEEPNFVYGDDEEDASAEAPEEEAASAEEAAPAEETSAKKKTAKKAPRTVDPAVVEGIVASMVPIPGKDYRMGKFQVTQAQWKAVMGKNPSEFKDPENPVEKVSWDDCQAFLKTLNAQPAAKASGLVFRLPEADEWETACRAGATGDYCKLADGTEITEETLGEVAWFEGNSGGMTHPVGQKKPNSFGLYDMHGNVWEWTATAVGVSRVGYLYCGGCWYWSAGNCESSRRYADSPSFRDDLLGFRLCADRRAD